MAEFTVTTDDEKFQLQEFVRNNSGDMSDTDLDDALQAIRDFSLRKVEASPTTEPAFRPGVEASPAVQAVPQGAPRQVVQAIQNTTGGLVSGARDAIAGAQQGVLEEFAGQGFPGAQEQLTQLELERRGRKSGEEAQAEANIAATGDLPDGPGGFFRAGEFIAAAAPEIAATFATRNISSGIVRATADMVANAVNGGVQFVEGDGSRVSNVLWGLAFGLPFAVAAGGGTFARKKLTAGLRDPLILREGGEQVEDVAARMGLKDESGLLVSQATRDPTLRELERGVSPGAGRQRTTRLNKQSVAIQENFNARADRLLGPDAPSITAVGSRLKAVAADHVDQLDDVRRANWKFSMAEATRESKGERVIDVRETMTAAIDTLSTILRLPGFKRKDAKGLIRLINDLEDHVRLGGMKADDFQAMIVDMTDQAAGTGGLFKRLNTSQQRHIPNNLKRAMLGDLELAVKNGVPGSEAMSRARLDYSIDSGNIDALREGVIERLFGKAFGPGVDEGTLATKLLALPPAEARTLISVLDDTDPLIADQMRGAIFKDLLEQHRVFAGSDEFGEFNLAGFFNDLASGRGKASTMDVLFPNDPELRKGFNVLERVLFGQGAARAGSGPVPIVREAAVTAGSTAVGTGNFGFILRFLAGIQTNAQMERILFAPDALDMIRKLAKPKGKDAALQILGDGFAEIGRSIASEGAERQARQERSREEQFQRAIQERANVGALNAPQGF